MPTKPPQPKIGFVRRQAVKFLYARDDESFGALGYKYVFAPLIILSTIAAEITLHQADLLSPVRSSLLTFLPSWVLPFAHASVPITALVSIVLIAGFFNNSTRVFFGTSVADVTFFVLDWFVRLGDRSAKNRTLSTIVLIILLAFITAGLVVDHQRARNQAALQRQHEDWLSSVSQFVDRTTLVCDDADRFRTVEPVYLDNFRSILSTSDRPHCTQLLNQLLRALYPARQQPWHNLPYIAVNYLRDITSTLQNIHAVDTDEFRAWAALNLLSGKMELSLAGGNCNDSQHVANAYRAFTRVSSDPRLDPRMTAAIKNGLGRVYTCGLQFWLSEANDSTGSTTAISSICGSAAQCAAMALDAYRASVPSGSDWCSFERKRSLNNIADLQLRLALSYHQIRTVPMEGDIAAWVDSPEHLATELERSANTLAQCAGRSPFVPETLITVSQTFAASAGLLQQSGHDAAIDLNKSGLFLRFALGFHPNLGDWDHRPYCSANANGILGRDFLTGLNIEMGEFPRPPDNLSGILLSQCPSTQNR